MEDRKPQDRKPEGTPYAQMNRPQKIRFVLKVVLCVLTFGLAFPNVMD